MTKKRKRHTPEQIVAKLRDADAMLNAGQDLAAVLQTLEVSEKSYYRWRNQYGGKQQSTADLMSAERRAVVRNSSQAAEVPRRREQATQGDCRRATVGH
ncbi:hypothetical protein Pan189_27720 [Stratiformator vulcanicus]|uniref:Transposase n=1 Tax=Stratiformator vulcanicus TaxID=2527980 RepID=A0A517R3B7_9PLAN|nr:transposase [Stratiformator vulcanicus]QDT38379.1 hypothetical protein Pan189_27720 [Stratiformator vulcanicus]